MTQASFEAAFIAPEEVRPKRLDANFYRATYRQAAQRAARLPSAPLSSLVKAGTVITYGVIKSVQIESGVPMLRIQNLQSGFADADGAVRISAEQHQSFSRSALSGGELLIAIGGYVGVAAKYPNDGPIANINQHVAKADIDLRRANDYYTLAYLWSQTGTLLLQRIVTGTVQAGISLGDLRAFAIPLPDRRIQDYIGAKAELAERCRSHSVKLRSRALELMAQSWAWGNRGPAELQDEAASHIAHTVEPRIFEDRLDPEFYRPSFLAVDRWLDGQPCWRLSELVEAPVKGVQPSYDPDGTVPALTVTHVDPFVLDRNGASGLVTDAWLSRNARARIEAGELLYTVTGPPLGETVVVEEFHLPAAVNSHVARVALRPHFKFPHLVAGMLNSPLGQLQTTRFSKGIRQKELYPVDFVRFRFPKLSSQTCTRLERDLAASCRLVEEARVLVEQANADFEALIEDTLDVEAILAGTVKAPTADDIPELAEDGA
jgi:hypothetical protein